MGLPWCRECDRERHPCSCGLRPSPLLARLALLTFPETDTQKRSDP